MNENPTGRELADRARELGVIDMTQGVVHTTPPNIFSDKMCDLLSNRQLHVYSSPAGNRQYREAVLNLLEQEGAELGIENVMATNGVTGGLVSALRSRCKPLDHVALLEPFYPAHDWAIQSLNLVTEYIKYGDNFALSLPSIEKILAKKEVTAFVLANPANPTGTSASRTELEEIVSLCEKNKVLLVLDEVYREFVWEGEHNSPINWADLNQLVVLRSFSKNLALAGWRLGYAVTNQKLRADMTSAHEAFYVGAPAPAQFVLAEILENYSTELDDFVANLVHLYGTNRQLISRALRNYGMDPILNMGAYYMMVRHNRESDLGAMQELLGKGIAVAPGAPFYRPGTENSGYLRMHFALSEEDREKVLKILTK